MSRQTNWDGLDLETDAELQRESNNGYANLKRLVAQSLNGDPEAW